MSSTDVSDGTTTALGHGLKVRHLTMMGLGSAIGAGLFLGTGVGIAKAGPAVLISYILAGAVVVFVMRMLGEMGAAIPASGSFSHYARLGIGEWAGFVMGWLYWFMLIMVLGAEITGASAIVNDWVPSIPQWVVALVFVVFFAVVNLAKVSNFGEFEFWFAAIKVTVIIGFLIIGVLLVFGILPDTDPVGTSNLFGQGGFMPNGLSGIAAGLLVVAFAFGGIEIVTIAAAESENPERSIAVAVRSVVWRISVFYIGAISIMVLVLPWNDPELESGPFVAVLNKANIPGVAGFMELVVVVALLSAFNANIYGTSRMAFSLSRRGDGPAFMAKLSSTGVPTNAVLLSVFFGFVSVLLNWLLPDDLLGILLNAVGAALLVIWIFIVVSHLRLRKQLEASGKLTVRMWLFPYLSYATLAMLGVFVVLMLFDADARAQLISTTVLFLVIAALGFLNARWRKQNQPV
ncbi:MULTISPECIES: amino acid permease [Rhodococcus]|jgi:aromatic amino acid permease|uniref:Aromatic amino acid transport protein n=4 Tax=Actinomycetes TaxID=1760 RepID=A0A6G9CXB0_RHOER|nr:MULTISPECIES: amino acid permease [Rhodococcus]EEN85091.1 putative GABA permease [Rhodococcus erythropolis SK121]ANQ69599.1 amino acid transporter [Rhodococcus sp. 008]AUS33250.1 amino acid permease [Rhodococcus qingshengii]AZI63308.1 amino acid permease [Rhodococcus sp. NJ-530]EME14523.1 aromatic amino acid transport protein [Rhodococcus qingshengii BKS 20-40]